MERQFKAGMKLKSAVCDTQIMVLRVPADPLDIRIGGAAVLVSDESSDGATIDPALAGGSLTGKRYTDADETMEFLCTKGGEGTITVAGREIGIKQAKALPSSD
ncbi:hypothetical protein ACFB49_09970 [Sphingomonas sp. DBB INV C78]|uniref:hypothetical protein n=1 Tax=Sphingomonas sp. DBB INV C78 TaxID=3349434 RepID=UPI0036D43AC0